MGSHSNNLNERGLLVVSRHISGSVLLPQTIHHRHGVFARGKSRGDDGPNQYMSIDSPTPLRFIDRPFARPMTFHLELGLADLCHTISSLGISPGFTSGRKSLYNSP